jgi:alkylation response protein AidB-like acyl-CoA dehydrogenase
VTVAAVRETRVPVLAADEALEATARSLGRDLAASAVRARPGPGAPAEEVDALSASGLLAITVPAAYGGADLPVSDRRRGLPAARRGRPQRRADPAQPLRLRQRAARAGHGGAAGVLLRRGARRQAVRQRAVGGRHEARARLRTTLTPRPTRPVPGGSTGSRATHRRAARGLDPGPHPPVRRRAAARRLGRAPRPGVTVVDDWDGMGQRTTASGSVRLENVAVAADRGSRRTT